MRKQCQWPSFRATMADARFFLDLGTIIIAAAVLVMLGRAVRMPAIVVYLLAGVLIGPVFGWV